MSPADLEGPAHLTSSGPSPFYERACLCTNRCKLPLCVKLENPELSREECDLFFFLLLSAALRRVCLYVCERERRNQRDGSEREGGGKSESPAKEPN